MTRGRRSTDRPASVELRDAVEVFARDQALVVDDEIQHELKHKALNRICVLEGVVDLAANAAAKCTCGAMNSTRDLLERLSSPWSSSNPTEGAP